jgi:hypothetical protein
VINGRICSAIKGQWLWLNFADLLGKVFGIQEWFSFCKTDLNDSWTGLYVIHVKMILNGNFSAVEVHAAQFIITY